MKNTFLARSYTKYDGEAIPRPFHKKLKLSIYLDEHFEILHSLFSLYAQVEV